MFHYAGVSSKNVTLSVPHLKEIINVATNIKIPSLTVYLEPDVAKESLLADDMDLKQLFALFKKPSNPTPAPTPSLTFVSSALAILSSALASASSALASALIVASAWTVTSPHLRIFCCTCLRDFGAMRFTST
ncbi:hypothetical protein BDR06DRAFT_1024851 [Suillus hirtellus]|nr:hypothetical protein BDR06DRAFT_1024851 [Suillus hirtellus]